MTSSQLPERPNLEQLKRQAKDLLDSARNQSSVALARFRILPAFAGKTDTDLGGAKLALHDAQSVIAREHGFNSWNALREKVEELTLEFDAAVDEFIAAATDGRTARAERLLALQPRIAGANFHTALLLGNAASMESRLATDPSPATRPGGPRNWEPLLYLCHCSIARTRSDPDGIAKIAQQLLSLGADPNGKYPWRHHDVRRPVLWGACLVTRNLGLAKILLEAGANPNDGVTLTLAAGGGDLPVLELLLAHGGNVNHPWATDGAAPLYSILSWAAKSVGIRWLLDHGADPDPVFAASGETPLHAAARLAEVGTVQLLVERGADLSRCRRDGRTPYALAELNGNRAVADWLVAHGASPELSDVDRFVAACSRADQTNAEAMLAAQPTLLLELTPAHHRALHRAAERGDVLALETMLRCGFDPNWTQEDRITALHVAAHNGQTESVRLLVRHHAEVNVIDREFHAPPLIWAADGARTRPDRDFTPVAKLLLAAGSQTDWAPGEEPADELLDILAAWRS